MTTETTPEAHMLNLTPHPITLRTPQGDVTFAPSGTVARVSTSEVQVDTLHGVPVIRRQFGAVNGIPECHGGVIVSAIVLSALPAGTPGVYAPDTGPTAIRDSNGQVVAVTRLVAA